MDEYQAMGKFNMNDGKWWDVSWNPVTGCSPVSEGCMNCYAERMAKRLAGRFGYPKKKPFRVSLHPDRMEDPARWKKPKRIFVCSMSDLFHENVPFDFILKVFDQMKYFSRHTFLVLTKRPYRAVEFATRYGFIPEFDTPSGEWWPTNVHFGITVENQRRYEERILDLLEIPASVRFISAGPMLSSIYFHLRRDPEDILWCSHRELRGEFGIICEGESGPGARRLNPDWVRFAREQCIRSEVPFFFKQWGEWEFHELDLEDSQIGNYTITSYIRVGTKTAGRLLDGREWNQLPGSHNTLLEGPA